MLTDILLLVLALGIFFYGVVLMVRTPESAFYCLEIEAGGRTFTFHFPKTVDADTRRRIDPLILLITETRQAMLETDDCTEMETFFYRIKEAMLCLSELIAIDRHRIVPLLHALDDEIEVRKAALFLYRDAGPYIR